MTGQRLGIGESAALVGRTTECAMLDALVGRVTRGQSGVLVLRGEAGIGKTTLMRYLLDAGSALTITRCAGVESEMELPFAGLHELCSPLLSGLDALVEPQRHALSVALGLETGHAPDRLLVALGALGLLAAVSEHAPMLCVVEDAHWLDDASAQVFGFIGRRLLAEPIALVFAARAPVKSPDHLMGLPELRVEGLDEQSARTLLNSGSAAWVDDAIRARVIDETHGNPLALLECGAAMTVPGFVEGVSTADRSTLSHRIEAEYLTRLSDMPRVTRQLVLLAAADPVGDSARIQRAATTLNLGIDAADPAIDAGLLTVGASVRFCHPLLRSAVYRDASIEDRRAAHEALAAVTDPKVDPDRRAWHRAYAASIPDENVAVELIESASRAQARGGAAAAAAFWERAVALTPSPADRSSRALIAAQAKFAAGDFEGSRILLADAEIGPLSELEQAQVDLLHAQMAFTRYRGGGSGPTLLLQAATRLQPLDTDLALQTYMQALIATGYAGRIGDFAVRRDIASAARALPLGSDPTPAQLLVHGVATWMAQGYAAAAPTLKDAVAQYRDAPPDPGVFGFGFNVMAMHLCDDEAWYAMVARQVDLARNSGALSWLPFALDSMAEFYVHAGDLVKAEGLLIDVDRIDPALAAATSPRIALLLAAWRGDVAAVETLAETMTQGATERGEGWVLTYAAYAKSVLFNSVADYVPAVDAAEYASAALDYEPGFTVRALYELVEAATRSDQMQRAQAAAQRLSMVASATGSDWACGMAARSHALLASGDAADELHREAIALLSKTRVTSHLARARLSYGEYLRRKGRRVDARTQLRSAHAALAAVGADGFAERAHRELQATGEKMRRRSDSASSADLTAQEDQIAQLARERRTNPEIGAELFLSARTVEWHLHKIFAKLEIKSRRELDAALRRREEPVRRD